MRNKNAGDILRLITFNSNGTILSEKDLPKPESLSAEIATTGDFDGDGIDDIVFRNSGTNLTVWYLNNGGEFASSKVLTNSFNVNFFVK